MRKFIATLVAAAWSFSAFGADEWWKPYSPPCVERENVFEFTEKPKVKTLGNDKYEITFAVKGNCDVTVGIVDSGVDATPSSRGVAGSGSGGGAASTGGAEAARDVVVRHLASGVLGPNAPAPFQKSSLKQTLVWNGKDDLGEYHKTPEKLKVRVQLGLKPEFDKRLGGTSPKNLPGTVNGIAAGQMGVFVFTVAEGGHYYIRKFDHDGNYLMSLVPPPANLPESKLQGMGYIEYEPDQRALHSGDAYETVAIRGNFLPCVGTAAKSYKPVVVGDRLFYGTWLGPNKRSALNHVYCDGSASLDGSRSRILPFTTKWSLSLAASPDGRQLCFVGHGGWENSSTEVWHGELDGTKPWAVFLGEKKPGSAEGRFNGAGDVDCDAQGRLYVCDSFNNRVQVFSTEGKFLKSISAGSPKFVAVHRKTGAVYLLHTARVEGKSTNRVTQYRSLDEPTPVAQVDVPSEMMALDSWAPKPRIWLHGGSTLIPNTDGRQKSWGLSIWEEEGNTFKKVSDFAEEAKKEDGANLFRWSGGVTTKMVCDPVREQLYVGQYPFWSVFDLRTGARLSNVGTPGLVDDIAFDKRGYMHCHLNPSGGPSVLRLDPGRPGRGVSGAGYQECPYDYGVEGKEGRLGILPVRDQLGAKFFQDGIGVNMRGDVAEQCNIYYAPKLDDDAKAFTMHKDTNGDDDDNNYKHFQADIQRRLKYGEEVYSIKRQPGVPLIGATVWTFDRNGELRDECAVTAGNLINGVMMDEDGAVYFVNNRTRMLNDRPFLSGRRGIFGAGALGKAEDPFTGTLIKAARKATVLSSGAPIAMEERTARARELSADDYDHKEHAWLDGAEWMYAGASPIVPGGCSCPTMRFHTDWYKRTFVPEAYRHSIGVVDTAGNLVLHIGRYGNFDSGEGAKSKIPVGGDNIAIAFNEMVSGTDNYLVFDDHGERLVVLKLNYHAEETVGIQ